MKNPNQNITEIYNYVNHSLSFVEAKNGVIVALNSGLVVGIIAIWEKVGEQYPFWYIIAFIPALVSLSVSLASFYPVSQKKFVEPTVPVVPESINLFRCESLEKMPLSQLAECIAPNDELSLLDNQKLAYIRKSSIVIARKYRLFRGALWAFSLYGLYLLALIVNMLGAFLGC